MADDLKRWLPSIEPLHEGPMLMSRYLELTRGVPAWDLVGAIEAKLLCAACVPSPNLEPIIMLLPAGSQLLEDAQ